MSQLERMYEEMKPTYDANFRQVENSRPANALADRISRMCDGFTSGEITYALARVLVETTIGVGGDVAVASCQLFSYMFSQLHLRRKN